MQYERYVGTVDTVRIAVGDRVVAVHRRSWGREGVFYDPVHYLALLERKPGALDFAAPLEGWELPVWTSPRMAGAGLRA